jgi:hypothetical protein
MFTVMAVAVVTVITAKEATTVITTVTTDGTEAGEVISTAVLAFTVVLTIIMEAPIIMSNLA